MVCFTEDWVSCVVLFFLFLFVFYVVWESVCARESARVCVCARESVCVWACVCVCVRLCVCVCVCHADSSASPWMIAFIIALLAIIALVTTMVLDRESTR